MNNKRNYEHAYNNFSKRQCTDPRAHPCPTGHVGILGDQIFVVPPVLPPDLYQIGSVEAWQDIHGGIHINWAEVELIYRHWAVYLHTVLGLPDAHTYLNRQ